MFAVAMEIAGINARLISRKGRQGVIKLGLSGHLVHRRPPLGRLVDSIWSRYPAYSEIQVIIRIDADVAICRTV